MVNTLRLVAVGSFAALALSGCYVVPVAPDGSPVYPAVPVPAPVAPPPVAYAPAAPPPSVLAARLYPTNDIAGRDGVLTGSVVNLMTGKGRFQLDVEGERLVGEATRVRGDERAGIANAYGDRGSYLRCNYRMSTPYQGTGQCTMSNGATYQVHIGS